MAYSVNWATKVVTVPKSDLTLITASPEVYELDVLQFWQNIHDIQDGEGIPYVDIMASNAPTSFGPRGVLIVNSYRVEFEDGPYQVNLVGANSDIDLNRVQNNVSLNNTVVNGLDAAAIGQAVWSYVGAGLTSDQFTLLRELWRMRGLDDANPVTVTPSAEIAGDITLGVTGDGVNTSTLTRQ